MRSFVAFESETGLLRLGFMTPKRVRATTKIPWGVFSRGVNDSKGYSKVVFKYYIECGFDYLECIYYYHLPPILDDHF